MELWRRLGRDFDLRLGRDFNLRLGRDFDLRLGRDFNPWRGLRRRLEGRPELGDRLRRLGPLKGRYRLFLRRRLGLGNRLQRPDAAAEPGRHPVLGLEDAAVLLCERIRKRRARHEPALDHDLAQATARPLLLFERGLKLLLGEETGGEEDVTDAPSGVLRRIHPVRIGGSAPNLKISFLACDDPLVPRDGQVELPDGGAAAWRDWGDAAGRAVVFLHGTPGSRLFVPQASPSGIRVVTFDRPGYGRSTPLAVPSVSSVAEVVARIADALSLGRFAAVGFSGGGPYALACGALLPDRVSRVAAVSSWGPIDEVEAAYASLTPEECEMVAAIRADPEGATRLLWDAGRWYVETPLRFLEHAPEAADEPVLGDAVVRANLADSNMEGARQEQAGLIGDWVADALPWGFRLADIGVPVDLWIGERDPGRAPLDAREIAARITACTVHADADAGHWLVVSHWPRILEHVLS